MVPDIYTYMQLALEHRQTLLREAEQERRLAEATTPLLFMGCTVLRQDLVGT